MFKCRGTKNAADFFKYRDRSPGSVLFKYSKTAMIDVCYSNTEEQQCWNCVIQIQRKSNNWSLIFKYRGTKCSMEVCYSNTEEQQRWNCVIQIQRNSNAGIVLFKYSWTATLELCDSNTEEQCCMEVCYLNFRGTTMLELCYSNTDEQQRLNCVIQIQMNSNAGIVLFKYRWTATLELCYSNTDEQQCWNCVIQKRRYNNVPWRCVI